MSNWIIQTHKNWAGSVGVAEQTPQSSCCVCQCYRLGHKTKLHLLLGWVLAKV